MMRCLLVIPIFFGSSLSIVFGQGTIRGKVFDNQTLEPLNGVYVIFEGNKGTLTDPDGKISDKNKFRQPDNHLSVYRVFTCDKKYRMSIPAILSPWMLALSCKSKK